MSEDVELSPTVRRVLELACVSLGVDLAWVSEFVGDRQVFRAVYGDASRFGVTPGEGSPLSGSFCVRALDGRLPAVIPDVSAQPAAVALDVTSRMGIGAYVGAPIQGADGTPAGMLCCVSRSPQPELDRGSLRMLELLAQVISEDRTAQLERVRRSRSDLERVQRLLAEPASFGPVFQPIVDLGTGRLVGYEALTRFADGTRPDAMFALAARCGLGPQMEAAAVSAALAHARRHGVGVPVWVNVSPASLGSAHMREALLDYAADQLVVEITEHAVVADYDVLNDHLVALREHGVRVAVDDAGAGYASLQHILRLRPDVIKLDLGLIRDIEDDPVRQALAHSLGAFGRSIGSQVLAEGIESRSELDALHRLGVDLGQGYLLARPGPLPGPAAFPRPTHRHQRDETDALHKIATATGQGADLESLVRPLLTAVVDGTDLDTAYLTVLTQDGKLEHRYVHNAGPIQLPEGLLVPWDESLCRRCIDRGIVWTDRAPTELPGVPLATQVGLQTYLSIALTDTTGAMVGTLCAASTRRQFIPPEAVAQARLCATLITDRLIALRQHAI